MRSKLGNTPSCRRRRGRWWRVRHPLAQAFATGRATVLDCGGAFYAPVSGGYQVVPPPIGATTWTLPSGAVDQNIKGVTYFAYGGAYYRPIYEGSGVHYEIVANPA